MKSPIPVGHGDCLKFERLSGGDELPTLELRIGVSDIVAMSIATRDFHPVHHDPAHARELGHPTLFINIMSTSGLVERFVRDWAGQGPRLGALKLKLGVPHYAGDTLRFIGRVSGLGRDGAGGWADIEFKGDNPRGTHASGQLKLLWP